MQNSTPVPLHQHRTRADRQHAEIMAKLSRVEALADTLQSLAWIHLVVSAASAGVLAFFLLGSLM